MSQGAVSRGNWTLVIAEEIFSLNYHLRDLLSSD